MRIKLTSERAQKWLWLMIAVTPALIALRGVFSLSSIFYVRDLGEYFYPNYLWIRRTVLAGHWPLWNPDSGAGYANICDPSLQLFFLPTLPFRFLLPQSVGFNLMVAFPFPIAAIGTYLFLKRHASIQAAALGAIVFSVSGSLLSSANSINPATTAAIMPWLLWATDRLIERASIRRYAVLATFFALGVFAGQPDMLVWAVVLVIFYAGFAIQTTEENWRMKARRIFSVVCSGALGLLLSAIQWLPLLDVTRRSHRGSGNMLDGWSIHPLSLVETLMPRVFSSALEPTSHLNPWLYELNSGREPYLISLYLGIAALLIGILGASAGEQKRWRIFWSVTLFASLIIALGYYTPLYRGLRVVFPVIEYFRYPAKLTIFLALALSALVAAGFDALKAYAVQQSSKRKALWISLSFGLLISLFAAVLLILTIGSPDQAVELFSGLAVKIGLNNATIGAQELVIELRRSTPQLLGLAACASLLLWLGASKRKEAKLARNVLFATVVLDLLMANASLNPTIELSQVSEPEWVAATRLHPADRVFIDDQSALSPAPASSQFTFYLPPDYSLATFGALYHSSIPYNSIRYGLRDAVIVDVTKLRPREYTQMIKLFRSKDADSRTRFLTRAGVRYFLQPEAPTGEAKLLQHVGSFFTQNMSLYEGAEPAPRVCVVKDARVEPNIEQQFDRLFAADFDPAKEILIDSEPPQPAGQAGEVTETPVTLTDITPNSVLVKASAAKGGGYLLLRDSYDPNWKVEVDGVAAPLLRANVLHRAVRLEQGDHTIRFVYYSRPLLFGAIISGLAALVLTLFSLRRERLREAKPEKIALGSAASDKQTIENLDPKLEQEQEGRAP